MSDSWESISMECYDTADIPMYYDQILNRILFVNTKHHEPSLKYLNIKSGRYDHAQVINWVR